jgi:hypothetical protein
MKLKLITLFAVLVFASVGIVGLAHAQDDETVRANIFLSISMLGNRGCWPEATGSDQS